MPEKVLLRCVEFLVSFRTIMPALLVVGIGLAAYNCLNQAPPNSPVETQTSLTGQRYLLRAEDFNLERVIELIKDNQLKNASDLEKRLNQNGDLNNVDVDQDGITDYIMVKESRGQNGMVFDFLAVPSSIKDESRAETIASLTFSQNTTSKDVQIQGGYPGYVEGSSNYFYNTVVPHHGMSFGDMFFLAWLFSPGRSMFYQPFMPAYYTPRPVVPYNAWRSQQPKAASGVSRSTKPSDFKIDSAAKSESRFKKMSHSFQKRSQEAKPRVRSFFKSGGRSFGGGMKGFRRR